MKSDIHPKYYPNATVTCSCGHTWTTGSTRESIRTDLCSKCHPFFTGEQRIVDAAGQVDRFMKRLNQYSSHQQDADQRQKAARRKAEQRFLRQQLAALDLNDRVFQTLLDANVVTVGELEKKAREDENSLLALEGFGPRSLQEIKDKLAQAREEFFARV